MAKIIKCTNNDSIFPRYKNTPIEQLLQYHNLGYTYNTHLKAELLVGMCMDNRKQLNIPNNFAYILRTGAGNLRHSEFKVSYTIAIGGIQTIVLIGHNNCGMVNLASKKEKFINGLINNAGWDSKQAEEHFMSFAPIFEIENEITFLLAECRRLRDKYPKVLVAPLFYIIEDNLLYQIVEDLQ